LNAAAGGGGHDLPTPVAHDIATFVKDKKITGRRFLRLNEVDLEESVVHSSLFFFRLTIFYIDMVSINFGELHS
jgi:hypothetical protein